MDHVRLFLPIQGNTLSFSFTKMINLAYHLCDKRLKYIAGQSHFFGNICWTHYSEFTQNLPWNFSYCLTILFNKRSKVKYAKLSLILKPELSFTFLTFESK